MLTFFVQIFGSDDSLTWYDIHKAISTFVYFVHPDFSWKLFIQFLSVFLKELKFFFDFSASFATLELAVELHQGERVVTETPLSPSCRNPFGKSHSKTLIAITY